VYNNNNLLGFADNGSFITGIEKLRPGLNFHNGHYHDQPFEFYFEFPRESLNYSGIDFSLHKKATLMKGAFQCILFRYSKDRKGDLR